MSIVYNKQIIYFQSSENMRKFVKNGVVDVIITSPPYNRGKDYSSDSNEQYNDRLPENEYLEFLERVWRECFRVASEKCVFFLNIGDSANNQGISEKVAKQAEKAGWIRFQDIIWLKSIHGKGHYTPSGGTRRFNNVWEHIYLFIKNKKKYSINTKAIGIPYADKSNIGRYGTDDLRDPGNVWHICYEKTTGATIKKGHDAPFPIGLPLRCIKCVEDPHLILDPFLGTGTTLAAAEALGVLGIGFELYPRIDIITETLKMGYKYQSHDILIPHYEITIKYLIKILEVCQKSHIFKTPDSKAGKIRFSIAIDTLRKLGIKNPLKLMINSNKKLEDF